MFWFKVCPFNNVQTHAQHSAAKDTGQFLLSLLTETPAYGLHSFTRTNCCSDTNYSNCFKTFSLSRAKAGLW